MINKTKDEAIKDMKNYKRDQFELYQDDAGWESWMEEYTESKDGQEITETENKTIEKTQKEMWAQAHNMMEPK